jgi:hypothetical protein
MIVRRKSEFIAGLENSGRKLKYDLPELLNFWYFRIELPFG